MERARDFAIIVLPVPGTSSKRTWPPAVRAVRRSSSTFSFPTITFPTFSRIFTIPFFSSISHLFRQTFQHHQFSRIVDPKRQCVLTQSRTCNHDLFLSCYSLSSSRPFCRRIVFLSVFPVSIAGKQTKIRLITLPKNGSRMIPPW